VRLHTTIVSYNRLELLKRTLNSYGETVTLPFWLVVVDNASDEKTRRYLEAAFSDGFVDELVFFPENRYPGAAANQGFELAPEDATLLHRSDNDMEYLPGWCDEVAERFEDPQLWQLGLRTLEEEGPHPNVGGNCILRREAYDAGLRYSEEPWSKVPFEDAKFSSQVRRAGKLLGRVQRPCVVHIGLAHRDDPYYQETFRVRNITFEQYGL
jgi:glycosyltransferase involved in cell wall biosynthesis